MKYFFDTEFIEDGRTIDLISIGIVCIKFKSKTLKRTGDPVFRDDTENQLSEHVQWQGAGNQGLAH